MDEVIDEILKTEQASEKIIQEARKKEGELLQSAEEEKTRLISLARSQARDLIRNSVDRERERVEMDYRGALEEAKKANEDYLMRIEKQLDGVIRKIIRIITTPEYKRD